MRSKKFQDLENNGVSGDNLRDKIVEELNATDVRRAEAGAEAQAAQEPEETGTLMEWIKGAAIAVVIAVAILQFIKPTIVQQHSMEPNFETNDYLFISRQSYRLLRGEPKLGDVIVFETEMKTAEGENKLLIKRVIGVPGDEISIYGGKVYLNGEELDDSYTKEQMTTGDIDRLVVPSDTVFCLGDNRRISVDSRDESVGLISYDDILGKVIFRLLPLNKIGVIENPYDAD